MVICLEGGRAMENNVIICDTTINQTVIDTVHRVILDSVTVEALKNSQIFYSNSFTNILWLVGIIVTISCAIVGLLGSYNWWKAKKYNEEMKKELKVTGEKVTSLENELKIQLKEQHKTFNDKLNYWERENQNKLDTTLKKHGLYLFLEKKYPKFLNDSSFPPTEININSEILKEVTWNSIRTTDILPCRLLGYYDDHFVISFGSYMLEISYEKILYWSFDVKINLYLCDKIIFSSDGIPRIEQNRSSL
jgi:hypothetical protein